MGLISMSTIATSMVMAVVTAVAGVFCTPLFNKFKSRVEAMLDSEALNEDCDKLNKLSDEIKDIRSTEAINIWIDEADNLMDQIRQFWLQEEIPASSSSNHNHDHLSGCLCANASCSRSDLSIRLKDMITRGEKAKRVTRMPVLDKQICVAVPQRVMGTSIVATIPVEDACEIASVERTPITELPIVEDSWHFERAAVEDRDVEPVASAIICDVEPETVKQISAAEPRTVKSMRKTEPEAVGLLLDVKRETVDQTQELLNIEDGTAAEGSLKVGQIKGRRAKKTPASLERILDVPNVQDGTTAERTLKRVMDALKDDNDDAWCVRVMGPGGVGKTTLAKAVNNKMKGDSSFSLVRFIELRANDEQNNVRDAIAKSLKLDMRDRIEDQILNRLQREKFLLILDNVWSESIHLPSIGIPERQAGCKILLTTRFRRECTKMKAKAIEMGPLTTVEAWQLFAEKAGEVVNDEKIKPLAKEVCDGCERLPLAIVVVGSAMKGETNIDEWQKAVDKLRCSDPKDVDIKSKVNISLKLGYDLLDDTLKACFLYCSLYPEGCYIEKNELVQSWLAENLIDMGSNYTEAYNKGLGLIKKLKELRLLDHGVDGDNWEPQTVKMHDMVRDVARRIGKSMKRSVVFSGYGISRSPIVKLPEEIKDCRWIAVVENRAIILPQYQKDNSSVTTILLRGSNSEENLQVSMEFLNSFRAVKVLNIEGVRSFVASLLQLKELHTLILRNCSNIDELPNQNNLKVLVLSYSDVRSIPRGMKKLSNLKELDLSYTPRLESVHGHIIRNLNFLEVLNMSGSGYRWPVKKRSGSEEATLQDLSELQWLREVYAQLAEADGTYEEFIWMEGLQRFFLAYNHPANRINDGKVFAINMEGKSIEVGSLILHAESLILHHIENVNEIFAHASSTDRSKCKVKSLEISKSGFGTSSAATIPEWLSLEILQVIDCPMLKTLPFMPSIKEIRGSIEWWATVEWDGEETMALMYQHFIYLD